MKKKDNYFSNCNFVVNDRFTVDNYEIVDKFRIARNPLVSVLMVTYNHNPFIIDAIKGVLRQHIDFPIELLIGEDCSSDGTRERVFDFQRAYPDKIRIVTASKNVGGTLNIYRLELASRGQFLAYCDGDDFWQDKNKLSKQVQILLREESFGLVFSNYDLLEEGVQKCVLTKQEKNHFSSSEGMSKSDKLSKLLTGKLNILTSTVLIRRDLLVNNIQSDPFLYFSNAFSVGDLPRWFEVLVNSDFAYIDEPLVVYRVLRESASRSDDINKKRLFWLGLSRLHYYLSLKHNLQNQIENFKNELSEEIVSFSFETGDLSVLKELVYVGKPKRYIMLLRFFALKSKVLYGVSKYFLCNYTKFRRLFFRGFKL